MENKNILPYLAGAVMSFVFGFSFIAAKIALTAFSQSAMLAMRFMIAALLMTALRFTGVLKISYKGKAWWKLLCISLLYPVTSFLLEAKGISMTSSSQAGIMISLVPVVTLVLGSLVLKERTTLLQKFMVLLSALGVIVTAAFSGTSSGGSTAGILILVCSVSCGAVQGILVRKLLVNQENSFSGTEVTYCMVTTGAVIFTVIALLTNGGNLHSAFIEPLTRKEGLLSVLYLGILCSVLGVFLMNYLASKLPVARSSVFVNLSTVISIPAGVFLGGETLMLNQIIGMLLILTGVWGANRFAADEKVQTLSAGEI